MNIRHYFHELEEGIAAGFGEQINGNLSRNSKLY